MKLKNNYNICVIDVGSPRLGNLGWCLVDVDTHEEQTGSNIADIFPHLGQALKNKGLILGLEAPLFVPLREDPMLATKARKGEGRRPWSAGAGAQVLTMNLPIMVYLFEGIKSVCPHVSFAINENEFTSAPHQIMLFEALVSGQDKGYSHINDAQIMARSCTPYSAQHILPPSILEPEVGTTFFNLAAAALLRCGLEIAATALHAHTPIYKPDKQS